MAVAADKSIVARRAGTTIPWHSTGGCRFVAARWFVSVDGVRRRSAASRTAAPASAPERECRDEVAPPTLTLDDVRAAAERLARRDRRSPCMASRTLSQICGCEVFLKFENLQFTASFKERGALNKMAQLTAAERAKGVLAVSAGNHAQAVAYHAERMGIAATIVMPRFASSVKVENTRGFGAEVVLAATPSRTRASPA
jgi:hypothetical protein